MRDELCSKIQRVLDKRIRNEMQVVYLLVTFAYSANGDFNGKDYPFVGAGTRNGGDTVSRKPIDAFTINAIVKKAGSVVNATRLVVPRDGKALTITENGTGPNGATHGVRVYKKR